MKNIYVQRWNNEWVDVTRNRTVVCCDCGLAHDEEYLIAPGDSIIRRAVRNRRMTAARRRSLKARKEGVFAKKRRK